jgi:hypothetical protein
MHSFQSEHNAVHWWLVVRGSLAYWPQFERRFPIIVYPGETTMRVPAPNTAAEKRPAAGIAGRPHTSRRSVLSEVTG